MNDLISRQEAIDQLHQSYNLLDAERRLEDMPSAQPDNDMIHLQKEQAYLQGWEEGREALRKERRWIPCENAPDTDRNVFIAKGEQSNMTICIGHYHHDYKQWYEDRNWFAKCLYDGLYWCEIPPLPEAYREEGNE